MIKWKKFYYLLLVIHLEDCLDQPKKDHPEVTGLVLEVAALAKERKYFDHRVCHQEEVNFSNKIKIKTIKTCFYFYPRSKQLNKNYK